MFHHWLIENEGIWLFYILIFGHALEGIIIALTWKEVRLAKEEIEWAKREYEYDEAKDIEKKQRRTKTTKKVTMQPGGVSTTEETTEVTEPTGEQK